MDAAVTPSYLRVGIVADGVEREFTAHGEPLAVVAAFRAWLSGEEWQLPMAVGVDELEREVERLRLELKESSRRERLMMEALGVKV